LACLTPISPDSLSGSIAENETAQRRHRTASKLMRCAGAMKGANMHFLVEVSPNVNLDHHLPLIAPDGNLGVAVPESKWPVIARQCLDRGTGRLRPAEADFVRSMVTWPSLLSPREAHCRPCAPDGFLMVAGTVGSGSRETRPVLTAGPAALRSTLPLAAGQTSRPAKAEGIRLALLPISITSPKPKRRAGWQRCSASTKGSPHERICSTD
jgi:hypothetical protein